MLHHVRPLARQRVLACYPPRRLLSIPVPSQKSPSSNEPLTTQPFKSTKLDLRPKPIKPTTLSATHIPLKATVALPRPSGAPTPPQSLAAFKEEVKRDIQDAEVHGVLKPPPEGANWAKRTLHKAIQIAKFYFNGVKLIFIRRKHINLIHARIKDSGSPLTRAEYRLIRTQKSDINKVVPFIFIALILEEIIPLIAIYTPFMLPSTCILPSQRERIDSKRADKATAFSLEYRHIYDQLKLAESPANHLSLEALSAPGASAAVCGVLRISTVGIDALRIRRIQNHLRFIAEDDQLLVQDKLLDKLSPKDLEETLGERGMYASILPTHTSAS
ncbi:hypothetical protein C0991_011036 [Blastosporella zonata]|nr:hypothetical protein C0991_011036 [Blastosporella zonata]